MSGGSLPASAVRIVVVHPDLMGTYGDGGNGVVLAQRLRWRGIDAELHQSSSTEPLPASGDIYCLGGGEDGPQAQSAAALAGDGGLARAVGGGAVVLAVCAGFQVLGSVFAGPDGVEREGLGLLDVASRRGGGPRAVGEVVVEPALPNDAPVRLPALTGYENHAGVTTLGHDVAPLGRVVTGVGNGDGTATEGAVGNRIIGTYLHGPVLARNPVLADLLLSWVVGPLEPLDDTEVYVLRAERLLAAGGRRGWRGRARRRRLRRFGQAGQATSSGGQATPSSEGVSPPGAPGSG